MEYRKELDLRSLKKALGMNKEDNYNAHQKKFIENAKECANSQWQYVNSYYDGDEEIALKFFGNAKEVYDTIYEESGNYQFSPGCQINNDSAKKNLKNTNFAGKRFKQIVVLYFTARLFEEAVPEIEFNDKQKEKALEQLLEIKVSIM